MIPLAVGASEGTGSAAAAVGGLFVFIVGFGLLFLAVVWVIFPFLVNGKFNEMIKGQKEANELLKKIAEKIAADAANAQHLTPNAQRLTEEKKPLALPKAEPKVYKL